ncbi:MAG: ABC-2 transporter permease [Lachnospiraceae bacterium]|nr:ABC-2 transporter permease [Lachnospiraceae bacterium]
MKGLIYRELYLARKNIGVCAVIYVLFFGITCLMGLSMRYGNIAKYATWETMASLLFILPSTLIACAAILIVTSAEAVFNVSSNDFKTPWMRYALATPAGIRKLVGAKYLTYLLLTGVALLVTGIAHVLCLSICQIELSARFLLFYLFLLCFSLLCMSFLIPLTFLIQNGDVVNWLAAVPIFIGVIIFNVYAIKIGNLEDDTDFMWFLSQYLSPVLTKLANELLKTFFWVLLCLIIVAIFIGSYFLSVHILDRIRYRKGKTSNAGKEAKQ